MIDYDVPILDDTTKPAKDVSVVTLPSLTYKVKDGRIIGKIDGAEAMFQAIHKIIQTERFVFPIYSDQYGHDLAELIGKEMPYVRAEVGRMFSEALKADDRVDDVTINDIIQVSRNSLYVEITVSTMYGEIKTEGEVIV